MSFSSSLGRVNFTQALAWSSSSKSGEVILIFLSGNGTVTKNLPLGFTSILAFKSRTFFNVFSLSVKFPWDGVN